MPLIEKRYSEALIKISSEQNSIDKIQDELNQINQLLDSNTELQKFVNNPVINSDDKKAVVDKLFGSELDKITVNFLKLLIDKGRIKGLKDIAKEYSALVDQMRDCLNIEVITAADIDKDQLTKIGQKYKSQYGSLEVKIKHIIDSSIIGGVIVKIGDKMIDSSVKGKLDGLLTALNN